jgi:hypothetical protein
MRVNILYLDLPSDIIIMYWSGWEQEVFESRLSRLIRLASVSEMCRISFDPNRSESLLCEYDNCKPTEESFAVKEKIKRFCDHFTIKNVLGELLTKLLHMKGKRK